MWKTDERFYTKCTFMVSVLLLCAPLFFGTWEQIKTLSTERDALEVQLYELGCAQEKK